MERVLFQTPAGAGFQQQAVRTVLFCGPLGDHDVQGGEHRAQQFFAGNECESPQ